MELGLVDDAVVFGVETRDLSHDERNFQDHAGGAHRIFLTGLPADELGYQGDLSDFARRDELDGLWKVLGWTRDPANLFSSRRRSKR